ncbi:MAG TPA: M48 family metalloprotease [Pyrinomonadaceae bacterium]|jgi:Zn-dependent protease with chaperone function
MKYEKYVSLIKKLEVYAEKNPKAYQYRVAALAALGYFYILGLIFLCILLPLLLVVAFIFYPDVMLRAFFQLLKLWWILLPALAVFFSFLSGAIRSLMAKVPEPAGNEIERADAPQLFEFVEKTCRELNAQMPEKILVNDDFNASVVTTPRFGIFGRKVFLNLGLPLMYALSPEQFRAVVTHEIGHISGKHGKFSKWTYQLHETWNRFIESQEMQEHKFSVLYEKFVKWFFPYFTAYSFVLMRRHEREADAYTVQLAGAKPLGEALISLETKSAMLSQDFWQKVFEENTKNDNPPTELFSRMALAFRKQDAEKETKNLEKFLDIKTDYSDTHPSLAERLHAIGYWTEENLPKLPEPNRENAAEIFFSPNRLENFVRQYDREWQERVGKNWKTNYEYLQNSQKRLDELSQKETLTPEELFEKALLLVENTTMRVDAIAVFRELLEIQPEHAEANYILGGILLEQSDESGLEYLNQAMRLDSRFKFAASETAFNYLRLKGRHDEAKHYVENIENEREIMQKAENERNSVLATDSFEPHKLTDEVLEKVTKKLSYHEEIEAAYLVCKTVQYYPEIPFHVLFLKMNAHILKSSGVSAQDVVDTIGNQLGEFGILCIYTFGSREAQYESKIQAVEKARIYGG